MSNATLLTPSWFKGRHCKAEAVGEDFYRITGPNLPECFLGVRQLENGMYQGYFRRQQQGPDEALTGQEFDTLYNAWEGTFELFRDKMIL